MKELQVTLEDEDLAHSRFTAPLSLQYLSQEYHIPARPLQAHHVIP
jgi:hypothetical protein